MGVHPGVEAALHVVFVGIGGHGDDRDDRRVGPARASNGFSRFETIHDGHPDIHQYRRVGIKRRHPEMADGFDAVHGGPQEPNGEDRAPSGR